MLIVANNIIPAQASSTLNTTQTSHSPVRTNKIKTDDSVNRLSRKVDIEEQECKIFTNRRKLLSALVQDPTDTIV